MTAEQRSKICWLNRAFHAEKLAAALREELERDKSVAERLTRSLSEIPSAGSGRNATEDSLIRLADTSMRLQEQLTELARVREEISAAIGEVSDSDMQAILRLHFLGYKRFADIAHTLNYSDSTVYRRYRQALSKVDIE